MWSKSAILLSHIAVLSAATPSLMLEERAVNCAAVNSVFNYFTKYTSQASSFCSLYLQTSTTLTTTVPLITKTITVANPSTVTSTVYVTAATIKKRDNTAPRPTWLPAVFAGQILSTACSCYVPSPPPKTITKTVKSGTEIVTQIKAAATTTITSTIYCDVPGCIAADRDFTEQDGLTLQQCIAKCPSIVLDLGGQCDTVQVGPGTCIFFSSGVVANRDPESPPEICGDAFFYDYRCKV